jgi:hypothetical protein
MIAKLLVILVVIAPDGRLLERAVHSLDLTIGPGVIRLGQAMFDAMAPAGPSGRAFDPDRTRWGIPTVKINGVGANPMRWPDGSFSIQGVAEELGITPQTVFDYLMTTALLDRLTHHCDIVETGNDSWRFKGRDDDHATRARLVSAIPASSDETSATAKPRRVKGVKIGRR